MLKNLLLAAAVTAALVLGATAPQPAQAGAQQLAPTFGTLSAESGVIEVRRRRARDIALAIGAIALFSGIVITAQRAQQEAALEDAWERCALEYHSLDEYGYYTTFGGHRRLCPYLRPYAGH
jgi:hypothetical protein